MVGLMDETNLGQHAVPDCTKLIHCKLSMAEDRAAIETDGRPLDATHAGYSLPLLEVCPLQLSKSTERSNVLNVSAPKLVGSKRTRFPRLEG